jgi:hypothetical protein
MQILFAIKIMTTKIECLRINLARMRIAFIRQLKNANGKAYPAFG